MIILYAVGFLLLLIPLPKLSLNIHKDYISKAEILPIKGFFVLLVFFRHSKNYFYFGSNILDILFNYADNIMGQLIVAMFFFYSGYGIYESVKEKGHAYVSGFPRNRLLKTWIHFAVCILIYYIYSIVMGIHYPLKRVLLSLVGWDSIGNSNWFMFVTFSLYILTFIGLRFIKNFHEKTGLLIVTALSICLLLVLYYTQSEWWWNTLLCYPLGMWYSRYHIRFEETVFSLKKYLTILLSAFIIFIVTYYVHHNGLLLTYILSSMCFSVIVILLTMRIKVRSKFLAFLGQHVFSIYILQRLVLSIISGKIINRYMAFVISFIVTVGVSVLFDKVFSYIDNQILNVKKSS